MTTRVISHNGLSLIDGVCAHLSREGPGRGACIDLKHSTASFRFLISSYAKVLGLVHSSRGWEFPVGSSAYDAAFLTRSFLEVVSDTIPKILNFPIEDQLSLFSVSKLWPQDKFVKYAKYFTVYPLAKYLKQVLPELPEGFLDFNHSHLVVRGSVRRLLKNRLVGFNHRNLSLWTGFLQGIKRGCAPVSESYIKNSMIGHRQKMLFKPSDEGVKFLKNYYHRTFKDFKPSSPRLYEATLSASWDSKRSSGGAREYLRNYYGQKNGMDELIAMVEKGPGQVEEVRGVFSPNVDDLIKDSLTQDNNVMVSAVVEPLKVRLITKGQSHRYWLSRFYQKDLWRYLQRFPQFALTGQPLEEHHLYDLLDREVKLGLDFPDWISGDYAAATDGLNIYQTKEAFETSLRMGWYGLDPWLIQILRSVLYEQKIHYPNALNHEGDLDPVLQKNGQLMGSTLSFPILCVINLCTYWGALEEYTGKEISIFDLPVLVNGDDILFRADTELYAIWLKWLGYVDFKLSMGKNYVHPKYLTANSQSYQWNATSKTFTKIGYVNTGLLTGQSKITGRGNVKLTSLWDWYNEVIPLSMSKEKVHKRFIHYHLDSIKKLTNNGLYNLALPFGRGGLGFKVPRNIKTKITPFQRKFATFLDRKLTSDVDRNVLPSSQLGIVKKRGLAPLTKTQITLKHNPKLTLEPKIGPHREGVVILRDRVFTLPPLAVSLMEMDKPEMVVRLPHSRVLKELNEMNLPRMGNREIYSSLPTVMEDLIYEPEIDSVDLVPRVSRLMDLRQPKELRFSVTLDVYE